VSLTIVIRTELRPAVQLTQELVTIPSVSGSPEQPMAQRLILNDFLLHNIPAKLDDHGNVTAQIDGVNPRKLILFLCHPDVVKAQSNNSWPGQDPFSGHIENGTMWGRGTVDMKGAIAAS